VGGDEGTHGQSLWKTLLFKGLRGRV